MHKKTFTVAAFTLTVGVIGTLLLTASRAATPTAAFEAESGNLSGVASTVSDGTASGGMAVRFGGASSTGPRYITSISPNGRYFLDQSGQPILVRGDSPWALMTMLSPSQVTTYLDNRQSYGVNSLITSLVGSEGSGYTASGATYDGILPFTNGNLNTPNAAYWSRMDNYLGQMRDRGMTAMLYLVDGWNTHASPNVFYGKSATDCYNYGLFVGNRYKNYPNIMWMFGGDYAPITNEPWLGSDVDHCMDGALRGVRAAGDNRPASIQLNYMKSLSTDNPYWESRVGWNFVYTYYPTYKGVLDGWNKTSGGAHEDPGNRNPRPSLFSEGAYENSPVSGGGGPEVVRRTALWALTSGSPGSFTGQEHVWNFLSDWQTYLNTSTTTQLKKIRDVFQNLDWWKLIPDQQSQFVTAGRGTQVTTDTETYPLNNSYATAAISADGTLATVYVPSARTITLDTSKLASGYTAIWIDPSNATSTQPASINGAGQVTTPSGTHDGQSDWLLVVKK